MGFFYDDKQLWHRTFEQASAILELNAKVAALEGEIGETDDFTERVVEDLEATVRHNADTVAEIYEHVREAHNKLADEAIKRLETVEATNRQLWRELDELRTMLPKVALHAVKTACEQVLEQWSDANGQERHNGQRNNGEVLDRRPGSFEIGI